MPRESKAELTDRLRREGQFEAFKIRREALKAQGVPAKEAWWHAAAEFPSPIKAPATDKIPAVDLSALKGKRPVPVAKAAAWVAEHLDADWITPADAPSPGAWSMREWARSSPSTRSDFYKTFVAKIVMPPQEEAQREQERNDAHTAHLLNLLKREPDPPEPSMSEEEENDFMKRLRDPG